MTDCSNGDVRDLLPDLLHGRLSGADRERVEAHVRGCEVCAGELALLQSLRDAAPRPQVDVAGIVAALPAPRARRAWGAPAWRFAAAVVFLAVGGSTVATLARRHAVPDSVRVAAALSHIDTAAGAGAGDIELSVGYGYSELTDAQLQALLKDVQQMSATPMAEPDISMPTVPVGSGGV